MYLINHDGQEREEWRPGVTTRMRTSGQIGATALTIFEQWCQPGVGAPTHWHPVEEVLTVLSGVAEIWIEGQQYQVAAGHSALIPAKLRHGFCNSEDGELHMLAVLAGPVFEAHFDNHQEAVRRWMARPEK